MNDQPRKSIELLDALKKLQLLNEQMRARMLRNLVVV